MNDQESQSDIRPVDSFLLGVCQVNWAQFWIGEPVIEEWCIEPILPKGQQAGIFSESGLGKSLLALDIAAAAATGRSILGYPSRDPMSVVYIDLEMNVDVLKNRLMAAGYGSSDNLSNLHYYSLPSLPPLDTAQGGAALQAIVLNDAPELIVLDTMTALVLGEENRADTYRNFYRFTGLPIKRQGISVLRLDHSGKNQSKGQRGSSSKKDELDVLWQLTSSRDRFVLTNQKGREHFLPKSVSLTRNVDPVRHTVSQNSTEMILNSVVEQLDALNVPENASGAEAARALQGVGQGKRKEQVLEAQKLRKGRPAFVDGQSQIEQIDSDSSEISHPETEPTSGNPLALLNHKVKEMYAPFGTAGNQVQKLGAIEQSRVPPLGRGTGT